MVGVRKEIAGAKGVTTLGPIRLPFAVEGRSLRYRSAPGSWTSSSRTATASAAARCSPAASWAAFGCERVPATREGEQGPRVSRRRLRLERRGRIRRRDRGVLRRRALGEQRRGRRDHRDVRGREGEGERRRSRRRPAPCGQVESVEVAAAPAPNAIDLAGVTARLHEPRAGHRLRRRGRRHDRGEPARGRARGRRRRRHASRQRRQRGLNGGDGDDRVLGGAGDDALCAASATTRSTGRPAPTRTSSICRARPGCASPTPGRREPTRSTLGDCEGVTVEAGRSRVRGRVAVSGIETYPCGFVPPPAPPAPPPVAARDGCVVPRLRGRSWRGRGADRAGALLGSAR